MAPPLYKYLGLQGAKLTLANRTFRHAKPSDFNDTEELTVKSLFPEDTEIALRLLTQNFVDIVIRHLYDPPTCESPMKEKLARIQIALRRHPEAAEALKASLADENAPPIYDLEHMRKRSADWLAEINEFMQGYRILCVSIYNRSERMWRRYADGHKGIALRIKPDTKKDSKFQLFHPVTYRVRRPSLYDSALDFSADGLFGNRDRKLRSILEKIVYTKTLEWEYEGEYRLAIPFRKGEEEWNTLRFHPQEITELYLGLALEEEFSREIKHLALAMNPSMSVFRMQRLQNGGLGYSKVQC